MPKPTVRFVCSSCGAVTPKWAGRCETCGEWNTIVEEPIAARPGPAGKAQPGQRVAFVGLAGIADPPPRAATGIAELDRVLGGGLVPASAVLVGGDPGIGKSTLLLQAAAQLARSGRRGALCLRRRIDRAGPAARAAAGARGRPGGTRRLGQPARHRRQPGAGEGRRAGGDRLDPDHVAGRDRKRPRHRHPGPRRQLRADPAGQSAAISPWRWSATSPRTARSPARACWSTWWTRCCISKATAATSSASCAR